MSWVLPITSVSQEVEALTVAERGRSHRIAMSPMKSLRPTVATFTSVSPARTKTSAEPLTITKARSPSSPSTQSTWPPSNFSRCDAKASSFSFEGSTEAKIGTSRSTSTSSFKRLTARSPCPARS